MHLKSYCNLFSIYVSCKKMKYSLWILKNKSFQETQISFPKCIEHQIFWTLSYKHWGFLSINKLSNLKLEKTVSQKMSWCSTVNALFFSLFTFCQKVSFGFLCTCYQLKWFQMQLKPKCVWSYTSVSFVSLYNKKYSRQFILILWHQFLLNMWAISPPWFYLTVMSQIDFIFHFDLA